MPCCFPVSAQVRSYSEFRSHRGPTEPWPAWVAADLAAMGEPRARVAATRVGLAEQHPRAPQTVLSKAVVHDFVKEFADKSINVSVDWGGDKLPHCGVVRGNHATAAPTPRVPVRKLGIK